MKVMHPIGQLEQETGEIPDHEVDHAVDHLMRAEEMKANSKLMAKVGPKLQAKQKSLKKVAGLKELKMLGKKQPLNPPQEPEEL